MKDKEIKIRADEEFVQKVDYLQRINGHKNRSETIRKTVEKEWRKEFKTIDILEQHILPKGNREYSEDFTEGWNEALAFAMYMFKKEKEKEK